MDDAPNARRAEKRGAKKLSAGYPRAALSFLPSKPRGAELGVKPPGSCRTRALSHGHLGRTRTVASRSPLTRATRRAAMSYILEVPGLADAIARAHVLPEHAALLAAIRSYTPFADAKLPTSHDGYWLSKRKVLNAAGKLVHDDHEAWLQPECERAGGDVRATQAQLKNLDYRLTECEITTLFVVHDPGGIRADDFVPLIVHQEDEIIDRRLFDPCPWREPDDLDDLRGPSGICKPAPRGERACAAALGRVTTSNADLRRHPLTGWLWRSQKSTCSMGTPNDAAKRWVRIGLVNNRAFAGVVGGVARKNHPRQGHPSS
jgi:hypothetical protein